MNNAAAAKPAKSSARKLAAYKAWDTMNAREELVLADIPADMHALYFQVRKAVVRGATAHERVECFMQYAHDNEGEIVEALQASADATVDAMIAEYESRVA